MNDSVSVPAQREGQGPTKVIAGEKGKIASLDGFRVGMSFRDCMELAKKRELEPREDYAFSTIRANGPVLGHRAMVTMSFQDGLPHGRLIKLVGEYTELHEKTTLEDSALFKEANGRLGPPSDATRNPESDPKMGHEQATWRFDTARITVKKEVSWPKGQPEPSWEYRIELESTSPLPPPPRPVPTPEEKEATKAAMELTARAMSHVEGLSKKATADLAPSPSECFKMLRETDLLGVEPTAKCILGASTIQEVDRCLDACRK